MRSTKRSQGYRQYQERLVYLLKGAPTMRQLNRFSPLHPPERINKSCSHRKSEYRKKEGSILRLIDSRFSIGRDAFEILQKKRAGIAENNKVRMRDWRVWNARKASRFRTMLQENKKYQISIPKHRIQRKQTAVNKTIQPIQSSMNYTYSKLRNSLKY